MRGPARASLRHDPSLVTHPSIHLASTALLQFSFLLVAFGLKLRSHHRCLATVRQQENSRARVAESLLVS